MATTAVAAQNAASPQQVYPSQLVELLIGSIAAGLNVLITGAPGIGKTQLVNYATKSAGADLLLNHPGVEDPTTPGGLPFRSQDGLSATFLQFGNAYKAGLAAKRTAWFLDDFGQATPATQASYMQRLLGGELNGHKLSDEVMFIAATNRRIDRSGVSGILEAVKSRFATIVELVPQIDDWCTWAYTGIKSTSLIAFLRYRPELLSAFAPTADLTNSPMPRTWEHIDKLEQLKLSPAVENAAFCGAVGAGAAGEYLTFRQMYNSIVNVDTILLNPDTAPIPTKGSELYAVSVALARKSNEKNFGQVVKYLNRVATEAGHGEFAVLTVRDAQRKNEKIAYTDAFVRMSTGPIGKLIAGQN